MKRRTPHGEHRAKDPTRPTALAYQNKENPKEVYIDNETGNTIYVGNNGRTHVFTQDGKHHTSFFTTRRNRIRRVIAGRWLRKIGDD